MMIRWLVLIIIAVGLDFIIGDPPNWPHPIRFIGQWIAFVEKLIRVLFKNLYVGGFFLMILTQGATVCVIGFIMALAYSIHLYLGDFVSLYFLMTALSTKCLKDEGMKVKGLIDQKAIEASKEELGYLVGRDTENLTEKGVIRGIIETVSENTIDGSVAPLFYMFLGIFFVNPVVFAYFYKATNTLDSMVGYKQAPYLEIGCCSAKFDDLLNFIPARLGALFMLLAGKLQGLDAKAGFSIMKRDHKNHKSPNCGYPESVTAGLLNIQLGGNNVYFGQVVEKPTIGDAGQPLASDQIEKACGNLYMTVGVMIVISSLLIMGLNAVI